MLIALFKYSIAVALMLVSWKEVILVLFILSLIDSDIFEMIVLMINESAVKYRISCTFLRDLMDSLWSIYIIWYVQFLAILAAYGSEKAIKFCLKVLIVMCEILSFSFLQNPQLVITFNQ